MCAFCNWLGVDASVRTNYCWTVLGPGACGNKTCVGETGQVLVRNFHWGACG